MTKGDDTHGASETPTLPDPDEVRPTGPNAQVEGEARERDLRLRAALEWSRFEVWCSVNRLPLPPVTRDTVTAVYLYVMYLAAMGRNVSIVARTLMRLG